MISWALKYLSLGFSVIPLVPNSKEPLRPWREFQKRHATEAEIRKWWSDCPTANIGLVCGKLSRIVAIDSDGIEALQRLKSMNLNSSIAVITGSGSRHDYFKYNGEEPKRIWKGNEAHQEIFLRSEGEYVVAPPSVHPNGRRYRRDAH